MRERPLSLFTLATRHSGAVSFRRATAVRWFDASLGATSEGRTTGADEGFVTVALVVRQTVVAVDAAGVRELAAAASAAPLWPRRFRLLLGGAVVAAGAVGAAVRLGQRRRQLLDRRLALEEQLRAAPGDGQRHVFRGLALAYMGRKAEAIAEGQRGVALWPISRDAFNGAYIQHQLVRIYLLVGEPEKALDQLEPLLKMPYYLSPGWLRIDPTFAPLKGNPRFERLIAAK